MQIPRHTGTGHRSVRAKRTSSSYASRPRLVILEGVPKRTRRCTAGRLGLTSVPRGTGTSLDELADNADALVGTDEENDEVATRNPLDELAQEDSGDEDEGQDGEEV